MLLTGHAEWAMALRENGCKEIKLLAGKSYHQQLVARSMQRATQGPLVLKTAATSTLQQWLRDVNLVQLMGGKNYMVQEKRVGAIQIKAMVITKYLLQVTTEIHLLNRMRPVYYCAAEAMRSQGCQSLYGCYRLNQAQRPFPRLSERCS